MSSTILACGGGIVALLRPGAVPREAIERRLGHAVAAAPTIAGGVTAPGMLASHYAPRAALRLDAASVRPGEALLAFGPALPDCRQAAAVLNLSCRGAVIEAAANLFAHLRTLDAGGVGVIAVMPVPEDGLGAAINDRLRRAAAPREGGGQ